MGGWTRRGAVVLGACLLAIVWTGGKLVRGISYAVPPPEVMTSNGGTPAEGARHATLRRGQSRTAPTMSRGDQRRAVAALLVLMAQGTGRNGAP